MPPRSLVITALALVLASPLTSQRSAAAPPAATPSPKSTPPAKSPPPTGGTPAPKSPTAAQLNAVLTELEPVLNRALVAYNAGNKLAFLAEFSSSAPGIHGEGAYRRLFEMYYKGEYGNVIGKRYDPKPSAPDRDWAGLSYEAAFQKHPKGRIVANFIRENGKPKLMQIRFDYSEPTAK